MHSLPILNKLKNYRRQDLADDWFAGMVTAILLVPQGMAYAILAGLPPQMGLYASILPPTLYALFGTSRTLSVGPVSIVAIMVASALSTPTILALGNPIQSAVVLALESGLVMLFMAVLRMGGLMNFISHPVLTGFTSGAALLIIGSQLPHTLGLKPSTCGLQLNCYLDYLHGFNVTTLLMSIGTWMILLLFSQLVPRLLQKTVIKPAIVTAISKCGPLLAVILATNTVILLNDITPSIAIVGVVPSGFPDLSIQVMNDLFTQRGQLLLPYASFIALITYIESVAIAKVSTHLHDEKIIPNQELIALSAANIAASVSGGMPVAGSFSRTRVNFSAGAKTPLAMLIAALLLTIAVLFCNTWFTHIPKAVLAVIILIAIAPLVKLKTIRETWAYDRGDGIAELATLLGVLILGIEQGIMLGILLTIASYLRKTSHPHIAVVGRVPNTEHYRNVKRHQVETWPHLLLLRIDENLTFTNINYIEDFLVTALKKQVDAQHLVLIFTSVSDIDTTALEALGNLNQILKTAKKTLNIAEVKGPVLDKLHKTDFLQQLTGQVFFRTEDVVKQLG